MVTLEGHTNYVTCLVAVDITNNSINNSNVIVSGSADQSLRVWNYVSTTTTTTYSVRTLLGHKSAVVSLLVLASSSLNDAEVVSCAEDTEIRIWSVRRGLCLKSVARSLLQVVQAKACLLLNNTIKEMAVCSQNQKSIQLSTFTTTTPTNTYLTKRRRSLHGHTREVNCLTAAYY